MDKRFPCSNEKKAFYLQKHPLKSGPAAAWIWSGQQPNSDVKQHPSSRDPWDGILAFKLQHPKSLEAHSGSGIEGSVGPSNGGGSKTAFSESDPRLSKPRSFSTSSSSAADSDSISSSLESSSSTSSPDATYSSAFPSSVTTKMRLEIRC